MIGALRLVISGWGGWSLAAWVVVMAVLLAWERYETGRLLEVLRERHRLAATIDRARETTAIERVALRERTLEGHGWAMRLGEFVLPNLA